MTILISMLCKVKVDTIINEDNSRKIQHPYREKTDKRVLKRNPWRDYGLHLTVLFLTIVAMYIGPIDFRLNILPCKTNKMDPKKTIQNC